MNVARRAAGKPLATHIWLWGLGRTPRLPPFAELHGKQGAMITAVDLLRGLAKLIGWQRIDVPGATGYIDTDYAAKGRYAVAALKDTDFVCVHVEATDEASHEGDAAAKIEALRQIDRHIVGPLWAALRARAMRGSWSVPIIRPLFARGRTAMATCPLRWPAAAFGPTPPCITTIRRPAARRSYFPRAGS